MIVTAVVSAAIITEWGTVKMAGGTAMMFVSAKAVAIEMMEEAVIMLIGVTLMAAQATATTAITVVAACDAAMAAGGTVREMAAVRTALVVSAMMMAADSISVVLSAMVVTAMMRAVTAMMRDAAEIAQAEMVQAEMVRLTPTIAMTGGTIVSGNNSLTAILWK